MFLTIYTDMQKKFVRKKMFNLLTVLSLGMVLRVIFFSDIILFCICKIFDNEHIAKTIQKYKTIIVISMHKILLAKKD